MRKDEAKKDPTDKAMRIHANPRKTGRPKVVMRPGSGIPRAARESARRNREMKPAIRPAISIAAIYIPQEERGFLPAVFTLSTCSFAIVGIV